MSNIKKAYLTVGGFTVGGLVLFTVLRFAQSLGAPNDVLAMVGIGYAMVGGLGSIGYVMWLSGYHPR